MPGAPAVKSCPNCSREIFAMQRGDITIKPPARVECVEASGNIRAICKCGRRVIWFKIRKASRATVTTG